MIRLLDRQAIRVLTTILVFVAVLAFLRAVRETLLLFLFALLFAYLFEPIVTRIQPWVRNSRGFAILLVYILLFFILAMTGILFGPRVFSEGQRLGQSLPALYERVADGNIAFLIGNKHGWSYETSHRVQMLLASHQDQIVSAVSRSGAKVAAALTNIGWIVIIPILGVFFLKDRQELRMALQDMIADTRRREFLSRMIADIDQMLSQFVRAQLTLAVISGLVYTVGLAVMRVPYAFVLGAVGGLLEFIPLAGPAAAAVGILGICFGLSYPHVWWVFVFLVVWRIVQDYVISPKLLGSKVELHPLLTIFGILAGGEIAGVIGIYLSVPVIATVKIIVTRWRAYNDAAEMATEIAPAVEK